MQGAGVKQTRSVCSPRARAAAAGRSRCSKYADSPRNASAQNRCDVIESQPVMRRINGIPNPRRIELYAGRGRKENASVTQTGTRFPNGSSSGKRIPESKLGMGFIFRMSPQAETATRNRAVERDALSQRQPRRKVHPGIRAQTGIHFPLHLPPQKTCAPSIPKLGRRKPKRNRRRSI